MKLTESGKIARRFLLEIPKHFQNVFLDKWIIMPNHIRGIIVIEKADGDIKRRNEALPRSYFDTNPSLLLSFKRILQNSFY